MPFEGMPEPVTDKEPSSGSVEVEYDLTPPEGEEGEGNIQTLPEFDVDDDYTYSDELTPKDEPAEVDADKGKRGGKLARRRSAPYRAMTGWWGGRL